MTLRGEMISLRSGDGAEIACYHVQPTGKRAGGLILIQEIFGVTEHIKELCDGFAADGFEVIAPSVFDRTAPGFAVGYAPDDIAQAREIAGAADFDLVTADIQMCFDQLADKGPVFLTGYCFGGSATWVGACRVPGLAAAATYYGRLIVDFKDETPRCPIILHFGERDATIPLSDVDAIKAAHPDIPVHLYPADHGFNSDRREQYDAQSTRIARERTLALFREHGAG